MDAKTLWEAVLAELQVNMSENNFKTWVAGTIAEKVTENSLEIICPSFYVKEKFQKQYTALVQESVNKIGNGKFELIFKVGTPVKQDKETASTGPIFETIKQQNSEVVAGHTGLSPKYTFENYIMGANNRLAYAIATAVAENPGKVYNPFFLYAGVGLGKTHLIQAVGNKIIRDRPNLKVVYCTGESFTNELIESLQSAKGGGRYTANKFRDKYRKVDVLLIDDIQFIAGRETTQGEFFHTFNALHMAQKQIVITSDKPPKDFTNLEERITSRFGSGIIADIQAPDIDMRAAILRNKRDQNRDEVSNDVIDFIATQVETNIRELEGAYLQVLTYAKATGENLTIESAARSLGKTIKEKKVKQINLNDILKAVCNYYSVKGVDLKGKRRTKDLVIPRQMAMYLIYDLTQTPYMSIGELLGGRDHTTILHGVRKIENDYIQKAKIKQDVANIKQIIYTE